jgi:hypothetical protein
MCFSYLKMLFFSSSLIPHKDLLNFLVFSNRVVPQQNVPWLCISLLAPSLYPQNKTIVLMLMCAAACLHVIAFRWWTTSYHLCTEELQYFEVYVFIMKLMNAKTEKKKKKGEWITKCILKTNRIFWRVVMLGLRKCPNLERNITFKHLEKYQRF